MFTQNAPVIANSHTSVLLINTCANCIDADGASFVRPCRDAGGRVVGSHVLCGDKAYNVGSGGNHSRNVDARRDGVHDCGCLAQVRWACNTLETREWAGGDHQTSVRKIAIDQVNNKTNYNL